MYMYRLVQQYPLHLLNRNKHNTEQQNRSHTEYNHSPVPAYTEVHSTKSAPVCFILYACTCIHVHVCTNQ